LTVQLGKERRLRLPSLAGAGYRWEVSVKDAEIAEAAVTFEEVAAESPGRAAFAPFEVLTIRGRRVGATEVRCRQRRSWEDASAAADERVLTVEVVAAARKQTSEEAGNR
jgi:predicted secreted protein